MQKDYNEYYNALVSSLSAGPVVDSGAVIRLQSLLILMQNNIFYTIVKITKLIKFYKLNWKDNVRLLANAMAFKNYLLRTCISNSEKKGEEANKLEDREERFIEAMELLKKKKRS